MHIETRQEYLERVLSIEKPKCPHCGVEMTLWEVPPINFSDGLGWGEPYLFVCYNDQCPLFVQGWKDLEENYAHRASMRCLNYPGTDQFECMPVFSPAGGQGQIVDQQALAEENVLKENIKRGFSILAGAYVDKDGVTVLRLLTDASEPIRVRVKAAEMIGDIGEIEAIEPLRCLRSGNEILQQGIEGAIIKIHERHFTRECPFCAEIIKKRALVCKHCNRDVSGL